MRRKNWKVLKPWLVPIMVLFFFLNLRSTSSAIKFLPLPVPSSASDESLPSTILAKWPQILSPSQGVASLASLTEITKGLKQQVYFIANKGQFPEPVKFSLQERDKAIFFAPDEVTYFFFGVASSWAVKIKFIQPRPGVEPIPLGEPEASFTYFRGRSSDWKTDIAAYGAITYSHLWPGIDLVYSRSPYGLKSQFVIHPGADVTQIALAVAGAKKLEINEKNDLVIITPEGTIIEKAPQAYQEINGRRVEVKVAYKVFDLTANENSTSQAVLDSTFLNDCPEQKKFRKDEAGLGKNLAEVSSPPFQEKEEGGFDFQEERPVTGSGSYFIYGFFVDSYDSSRELVIDPVTLVSGTFLGGPSFDYAYGLALDNSGYVYLTGYTYSISGFPRIAGPQLSFSGGDVDAFVLKLDPATSRIIYCGYLGGADRDYAYDIAVDDDGSAYVVGYTASRENSFPVIKGPDLTHNGLYDAFIAKINPAGTALEFCGYLGGADNDFGRGVAVDGDKRAYITGYTLSNELSFPVKVGPTLTFKGDYDAFVARLTGSGEQLEYCGYVGGAGNDWGYGVAVDPEGGAYLTGATRSDENSFPVTSGPDLTFNGQVDAFIAKVAPTGETLRYCGYLGGDSEDGATAITLDPSGCAYISGYTSSDENSFPVNFGPDFGYNGGFYDAFIAKVWPTGEYLVYCGYIGGSGYDVANSVAVDDWGCAYVTGYTSSEPDSFPVKEGPELSLGGSFDAFVAKVVSSGSKLDFCGYVGGVAADYGQDIAVEKTGSGTIYLAGSTYSPGLSFPEKLGPGFSFQGKRDAFLLRFYENSITVTSPNGGEVWYSGFEKNIIWRSVGEVGPVKIELSSDNGENWQEIIAETENDGLFTWTVPEISSTTCLIRVSEADDGVPSDISDSVFVLLNEPVIVVTSPNGGEEWPVGSIQEITWLTGSAAVGNVRLEYSTDNGVNWVEIVSETENDGVFEWEVPDAVSSQCLIRVSEAADGNPADTSDAAFSIVPSETTPSKLLKLKTGERGGRATLKTTEGVALKPDSKRGGSR